MKDRNSESKVWGKNSIWWIIAVAVVAGIIISPNFYSFAIVMFIVSVIVKSTKKSPNNDEYTRHNMGGKNNNRYTANKKDNSFFFDGCDTNICPVCDTNSANGYCVKCGYRFRR